MAQGKSGRIVIDVDPEFKEELYKALALNGYRALKDWFIEQGKDLCEEAHQPLLSTVADTNGSDAPRQKHK